MIMLEWYTVLRIVLEASPGVAMEHERASDSFEPRPNLGTKPKSRCSTSRRTIGGTDVDDVPVSSGRDLYRDDHP